MSTFAALVDKYNLPKLIKVKVSPTKQGFIAKLPDYPGCVTYATSTLELLNKVTDALLTYLEIPSQEAKKIDIIYVPVKKKGYERNTTTSTNLSLKELVRFTPYSFHV